MANLTNNSLAPNSEQKIRFKQGYFGLKIIGYIPPALMEKIAIHGKYWSPYEVQQYLQAYNQKGNPNSLKGWYFTNEAINVLITQGCKIYIKTSCK